MAQNLKRLRPLLPGIASFVIITVAMIVALDVIGLDRIRQAIESAGPLAPLAYIFIKIITYVVAPLSSGPIQLSAGILFGLVPGILFTLIGEVIGGSINFLLARYFGRPVVERLVGQEDMPRVDKFVSQIVDWRTLIYARLFLFSIYDFISYAVGFSKLKFRTYVIVSLCVGIIPTAAAVLLGTTLTGERSSLILLYVLVGAASIIPLIFQKRIRRWLKLDISAQASALD
ncbi:MAG TPA: VTT domain-containing protein [Phototrophicaceae bacterium]|nr:VTT domain-containing protein [Phototrophicaceae bacterium]